MVEQIWLSYKIKYESITTLNMNGELQIKIISKNIE